MIADALYVGDTSVDRVMLGDVEVWSAVPNLPVVTIMGTATYAARDQFRAACVDYGTTYQTVTVLPFLLDTSNATTMRGMFDGCSALTQVPPLDTSNVTRMDSMFSGCSSLTHVPDMDTSNVTRMDSMFDGCSSLTHAPDMDTSNVTRMDRMFWGCSSLTHAPDMDTSGVTNMSRMFQGCSSLTHVPDMETSQVTRMDFMFRDCAALTDGNVRLIGKHPSVSTVDMLTGSGLTRQPFYDTDGNPI